VRTITTGGDVNTQTGFAHSVYSTTSSMVDAYFYNGDAEMLFVFEHGNVRFWTEFGIIDAEPSEIVVIPRGVKLRVEGHCHVMGAGDLGGSVGEYPNGVVQRPPLPGRDHQSLRVAVLSVPAKLS
jgi:homogentisate 1,2-dioxygenase